ncbi:MAG: YbhN family protein, partial [Anaerolineae bacterium]
ALSGDKGESPLSSSSERGARSLWSALSQSKLAQQLQQLYESIHAYEARSIWKALSISFVFNIALIAMNYLIALALEVDIPIWYFLLFVPLTSIILMIPFSLGGLGIREAGYVALFAQAGVPDNVAFSMSLLIYAMTVVAGLIGGVIYAVRGAREYVTEEG